MELIFQFALLSIGLALLWKVGELAVKNAVCFSNIFGIARFTIGFFLFAISTGLPEISSAVISSIKGIPELSSGVLMGSTFVNLSLFLGLVALLSGKIKLEDYLEKNLLWTSLLIFLIFTGIVFIPKHQLFSGIILIVIYIASFFFFPPPSKKTRENFETKKTKDARKKNKRRLFFSTKTDITIKLLGSLTFLLISSWITVHAAANISELLKIDVSIIGASLVAIGTGLPELALEIHAVKRREYALALGDIFGSSLLNVSLVLGILILANQQVDLSISKIIFPFIIGVLGWVFFRLIPKKPIKRIDSIVFIGLFVVYLITLTLLQKELLDR